MNMIGLFSVTEKTNLAPADSPVVPPAPWVGLNATMSTRKYDLQVKHG